MLYPILGYAPSRTSEGAARPGRRLGCAETGGPPPMESSSKRLAAQRLLVGGALASSIAFLLTVAGPRVGELPAFTVPFSADGNVGRVEAEPLAERAAQSGDAARASARGGVVDGSEASSGTRTVRALSADRETSGTAGLAASTPTRRGNAQADGTSTRPAGQTARARGGTKVGRRADRASGPASVRAKPSNAPAAGRSRGGPNRRGHERVSPPKRAGGATARRSTAAPPRPTASGNATRAPRGAAAKKATYAGQRRTSHGTSPRAAKRGGTGSHGAASRARAGKR